MSPIELFWASKKGYEIVLYWHYLVEDDNCTIVHVSWSDENAAKSCSNGGGEFPTQFALSMPSLLFLAITISILQLSTSLPEPEVHPTHPLIVPRCRCFSSLLEGGWVGAQAPGWQPGQLARPAGQPLPLVDGQLWQEDGGRGQIRPGWQNTPASPHFPRRSLWCLLLWQPGAASKAQLPTILLATRLTCQSGWYGNTLG